MSTDTASATPTGQTSLTTWKALARHRDSLKDQRITALFEDADRFGQFNRATCGILLDFSKTLMTEETLALLVQLARDMDLEHRRNEMLNGHRINSTENRAVLHTALRRMDKAPVVLDGHNVVPDVERVVERMGAFVERVHSGDWTGHTGKRVTDVVNIGIGGSDLGPRMVCHALRPYRNKAIETHFVSNVDGADIGDLLERLDPTTTLFIVASKTFTTLETMTNALSARSWFLASGAPESAIAQHFVAVSTNAEAVAGFGINPDNAFEFWDWVGGRYSLWAAIGLSIALGLGMEHFNALRKGAFSMDQHFAKTPLEENLPVLMALIGIWHSNFLGCASWAMLPYSDRLTLLPAYLQQADMESNGKGVTLKGDPLTWQSAPVLWGGVGTNVQHSFFQHLHQGTQVVPGDFIGIAKVDDASKPPHQRLLMANMFAQTEALMRGRTLEEARTLLASKGHSAASAADLAPHMTFPGNRPSSTLLLDELSPARLGALIALYEHKIFTQGVIWDINSFDQFGVELGKTLATQLLNGDGLAEMSGSTRSLIEAYNSDCRKDDRL